MKLESKFSPGDKAWVFRGFPEQLTVGKVCVEVVDSAGDPDSMFSNHQPQKSYRETYMCVETGVGGGNVYELGKHIFATRDECVEVYAELIRKQEAEAQRRAKEEEDRALQQEASLRKQLAHIEAIKALRAGE